MNTETVSLIKQYKSIPEVLLVYPSPTAQYQMRPYFIALFLALILISPPFMRLRLYLS